MMTIRKIIMFDFVFIKIILITTVTIGFLFGCNSHAYYDEAQLYMSDAVNVLIKNNICKDQQDCANKELVKFESGRWSIALWSGGSVNIFVYEVANDALVAELHFSFSKRHMEMQQVPVHLNIYSTKHGEPREKYMNYSYR